MPAPGNRRPAARIAAAAAILFFLSLSACLSFLRAYPLPEPRNDDVEYLSLARSVAQGTGFSTDGGITPAGYRPPLFSSMLGGWFRATGTSSVLSAALFQSLLHAFGTVAAFALFLELLPSPGWAFGAALFLAVNPLLVTRAAFVLLEPTTLLFTTLAAWATVRWIKAPSTPKAALAGAAWGVCTLGKVVSWYVPLLLVAMRYLPGRLRVVCRGKEAAALFLFFALTIAPWTLRNYLQFHRFIPVNDQGGGQLWWNVTHAEIPGEPSGELYAKEVYAKHPSGTERRELLWKYVKDHPYHFLVRRVVKNAVHFAAPSRDWWIFRGLSRPGAHSAVFWVLAGMFHVPLYLFLVYRTWQWGRGGAAPAFGFVILLYWTYWIEHALVWGDPRYGLTVYPILVGMACPPDS